MGQRPAEGAALYTIGHSRLTPERFVELLQQHDITLVVDVRSAPYSGIAPWFNKQPLQQYLRRQGIKYRFAGQALGGRPDTGEAYDAAGRVDYERMTELPAYRQAIARLKQLIRQERACIMCGEGDYRQCHRHRLIGRTLQNDGLTLHHILADGSLAASGPETWYTQPGLIRQHSVLHFAAP